MMRVFLAGLCLATVVVALPSADEVVPETALFSSQDEVSSFAEAQETVRSMLSAGKSDDDCRKLATDSIESIKTSVANSKKILEALPDGSACVKTHDDTVQKVQDLKDKADKDVQDKADAVKKACDVKIDFKIHLDDLQAGQCDVFLKDPDYTAAKKSCDDAKLAKEKADGAKVAADKALKDTKESAAKTKNTCFCSAKAAHKKAWEDATKTKDQNEKDWTKAHQIECALDGTPHDKCAVPSTPKPDEPKMIDEGASAVCTSSGVALIINGQSGVMHYDSAYWTNDKTGDIGGGNSKTALFFQKAKRATFKFKTGSNDKEISVDIPNKSLLELFQGGFTPTTAGLATWRGLGETQNFAYQNKCNRQGFNVKEASRKMRFGLIMNQESDCNSPDSQIGIGPQSNYVSSYSAGGFCACCQNGGTCRNNPSTVEVHIEGAD